MPVFQFGSGQVISKVSGQAPQLFGTLQEIEIDFDQTVEELRGQYKLPDAIGQSVLKVSGKAKVGQLDINFPTTLLLGSTVTAGQVDVVVGEAKTIPASTPWTVTVTGGVNMIDDYGVRFAATGQVLTPVASGPVAGQYSVNTATGVYTFASADANKAVLINYTQNIAATGSKSVISQQLMGTQPVFSLVLTDQYQNFGVAEEVNLVLNRCVASKFTMPYKNTNFMVSDFEFSCFADASGNLGTLSVSK